MAPEIIVFKASEDGERDRGVAIIAQLLFRLEKLKEKNKSYLTFILFNKLECEEIKLIVGELLSFITSEEINRSNFLYNKGEVDVTKSYVTL